MKLARRFLSIVTASVLVITMGLINVSASTKITTSSITDQGEIGLTLSEVKSLAADAFNDMLHYEVLNADFTLDASNSTASLTNSVKTKSNEIYVLVCDDIETESGYTTDIDLLTYTYQVSDLYELTISSITIDDSVTGKTKAKIQDLAAEAFNDKHYAVESDDFEQQSGPTLSSSVTTKTGNTYVFVCEDVNTESDYSTDVDKLTYKYVVVGDDDTTEPTYGTNSGWDDIEDSLDDKTSGSALITMNGNTTIPSDIIASIKGKDIDLTVDCEKYTWTINGKNVTSASSIDLKAIFGGSDISSSIVNTLAGTRETTQLALIYSGNFGFKAALTAYINTSYAGKYANLYYYNPTTKALEFQEYNLVSSKGYATFNFTHASNYVIVIDSSPMGNQLAAGENVTDNAKPIA